MPELGSHLVLCMPVTPAQGNTRPRFFVSDSSAVARWANTRISTSVESVGQ